MTPYVVRHSRGVFRSSELDKIITMMPWPNVATILDYRSSGYGLGLREDLTRVSDASRRMPFQ